MVHENALLADLPSLKALMTTHNRRTIADAAVEFWNVSGSDLFALADKDGFVLASDVREAPSSPALDAALQALIADPHKHYLVFGSRLFDLAVQPLYFGSEASGILLGRVVTGYSIDRRFVDVFCRAAEVQAAFLTNRFVISSTLSADRWKQLADSRPAETASYRKTPFSFVLGNEQYLATAVNLSENADMPLQLILLKSLAESSRISHANDRLILLLGLAALLCSIGLTLALSRLVTDPLETLAAGVHAFGLGNPDHPLPKGGTREVRELSTAFAQMRRETAEANLALLESERLATIGRMASSVSHDLRHYLAAVYANAEFLSSSRLSEEERAELFSDIQAAVHGTTELIDSLLVFSRSGARLRVRDSVLQIVKRAISLLRAHPDAHGVDIQVHRAEHEHYDALVDAKKVERAFYNLLLNACQSARMNSLANEVRIEFFIKGQQIAATITDSGAGIPDAVRDTLFEAFVSEGKQSGTGLGLTLAHAIAGEHGGMVTLLRTCPGETVFQLTLDRSLPEDTGIPPAAAEAGTPLHPQGSSEGL